MSMKTEEASGINLPSDRLPGRASRPSQIRVEDGGGFRRASVENNQRPNVFRVNMILWASEREPREPPGAQAGPTRGSPLDVAGGRPCPVGGPSGCPPDSIFVSS